MASCCTKIRVRTERISMLHISFNRHFRESERASNNKTLKHSKTLKHWKSIDHKRRHTERNFYNLLYKNSVITISWLFYHFFVWVLRFKVYAHNFLLNQKLPPLSSLFFESSRKTPVEQGFMINFLMTF